MAEAYSQMLAVWSDYIHMDSVKMRHEEIKVGQHEHDLQSIFIPFSSPAYVINERVLDKLHSWVA